MKSFSLFSLASILLLFYPPSAHAQNQDQNFLSVSAGYYDVFDDNGALDLRAEYRPNVPVLVDDLRPWLGAEITTDGSVWAGGGLLYDLKLAPNWYAVPSFGAGLYAQGSSDLDLDSIIEFRSQLEIAYQFEAGQRVGVALSHTSNADLGDDNPGVEVLSLYYHFPY